jgi:hypothetical protein
VSGAQQQPLAPGEDLRDPSQFDVERARHESARPVHEYLHVVSRQGTQTEVGDGRLLM